MYVRCYNYNEMCRVRDEKFVHLLMMLSVRPYGICSTILQKEQIDQKEDWKVEEFESEKERM